MSKLLVTALLCLLTKSIFSQCEIIIPSSIKYPGQELTVETKGCAHEKFEMSVYNRWGELMHNSTDPSKGWNGGYRNGWAPDGMYFVAVKCDGLEVSGSVAVINLDKGEAPPTESPVEGNVIGAPEKKGRKTKNRKSGSN